MRHFVNFKIPILVLVAFLFWQCKEKTPKSTTTDSASDPALLPHYDVSTFGKLPDGREVFRYTLVNSKGMEVDVITYGGIITRLTAPDRNGDYEDVVLGFDTLQDYLNENPYFGALIGRYGNRIAKGRFGLNGKTYTLATNNGQNHLHGGVMGFDKVLWDARPAKDDKSVSLVLTYVSPDGEEGYPGTLQVQVTYTLTNSDELKVTYWAQTDKQTIVNLTQHTYFNLSGEFRNNILDHMLYLNADRFLPVDATLIPTGELREVTGTPFDFRRAKQIGSDIGLDDPQLVNGGGFDHCWALVGDTPGKPVLAARVTDPKSGRVLEVATDQPGIQFYSGNFLDGSLPAKNGGTYPYRGGLCLETQHFPDSPNQPEFPSVVLTPGETYTTETIFSFRTDEEPTSKP